MTEEQIENLYAQLEDYRYLLKRALKALDEVYEDEDHRGNYYWRVGDTDLISKVYNEIKEGLEND